MVPKNYKLDPAKVPSPGYWQTAALSPTVSNVPITGSKRPLDPMLIDLVIDVVVPQLVLLVNPDDFQFAMAKVINERRTRGFWHHEHWGNELDKISASGSSAAFFVSGGQGSSCVAGLTRFSRVQSAAFQNIRSLEMLYRNNGYNFVNTQNSAALTLGGNLIDTVGLVVITFRNKFYRGRFDDFSLEEDSAKPFLVNWSFSFTVHEQGPLWMPDYVKLFLEKQQQLPVNQTSPKPNPTADVVAMPEPDPAWNGYEQALTQGQGTLTQSNSSQGATEETPFDDYEAVQAHQKTEQQVVADTADRLDTKTTRTAYSKLVRILQARKDFGLSMRILYAHYSYVTGVLDLTGLVSKPPFSYVVGPLTQEQYTYMEGML